MSKNNIDFIIYATNQLGKPYIYGTYGEKLTTSKLNWVHKTYPSYLNTIRLNYALNNYLGQNTHDCSGLFKGYMMNNNNTVTYNSKYDKNVQGLFYSSNKKYCIKDYSNTDLLNKFNTTIGLALCNKSFGHIIYIVDEFKKNINDMQTIEAKGFDYGVVNDKLINILNRWSDGYIFELPFIEYVKPSTVNTTETIEKPTVSYQNSVEANKMYYTSDDVQKLAKDTINGKYGNGQLRRDILKSMNISYDMVQARVNAILKGTVIKSDLEIAKEVYRGVYENGYTRQQKITNLGYDYRYIQKLVNDYINSGKWVG